MMVATDSIHVSIFAVVARRKGWTGRLCDAEFPKFFGSVGLCQSSTLDVANTLIKLYQSTILMVTATPRGSKGSLGRGERANLTIRGRLRAFREGVSMKYKTEIGPRSCVDGLDGSTTVHGL